MGGHPDQFNVAWFVPQQERPKELQGSRRDEASGKVRDSMLRIAKYCLQVLIHNERRQEKKRESVHAVVLLASFASSLKVQEAAMTMFRCSPIQPVLALTPLLPVLEVVLDSTFLDSTISFFSLTNALLLPGMGNC